jgi:hypothetical protein
MTKSELKAEDKFLVVFGEFAKISEILDGKILHFRSSDETLVKL